jgi:hypothetical protein
MSNQKSSGVPLPFVNPLALGWVGVNSVNKSAGSSANAFGSLKKHG